MPRQPLRKLRPELFEEERNLVDAFIFDHQAGVQQDQGQDQVWVVVKGCQNCLAKKHC